MAGEWRKTIYGPIARDFAEDTLRNLCDPVVGIQTGPFGSQLHQEDYVPVGTPIITVEHLGENRILHDGVPRVSDADRNRLSRYLLRTGDIVFSRVGSVDRRALVRSAEDGWMFSGRCLRVRPNPEKIDSGYLSYFFGLPAFKEYIRAIAVGATMPSLNTLLLSEVVVPHPKDIAEQRSIAHILGKLDDKIELNRRMNETLESMARAIFKSWFVDFDPVRAKAEGRDPGLPKPIADLFPDSFEDSELGEIPKGWSVRVLGDVLSELETGGRPKGGVSSYSCGTPSIGAESIVGLGVFDYSKTKYIPDEFFEKMTKGRIKNRDVLLYKDGGRPGEFEPHVTLFGEGFPFHDCAINEHVYRMRANPELGQNFLFFWLSSEFVMEEMRIKGTGVAIPGLNSTQVKSLTTLVPKTEVTKAFDALVDPCITRILAACNESRALSALRDALLPKLISGELRVVDIERFNPSTAAAVGMS